MLQPHLHLLPSSHATLCLVYYTKSLSSSDTLNLFHPQGRSYSGSLLSYPSRHNLNVTCVARSSLTTQKKGTCTPPNPIILYQGGLFPSFL